METENRKEKTKKEEIEEKIVELAKNGLSPSKIGIILRDEYGVPKIKIYGKKIMQILREKKVQFRSEEDLVKERIEKLKKHSERHKHDYVAKRAITKQLWAMQKLQKKKNSA